MNKLSDKLYPYTKWISIVFICGAVALTYYGLSIQCDAAIFVDCSAL